MKKILIVTLYGLFNYGNRLQNYAVQKVLGDLGCKVTTLKNVEQTSFERFIVNIKNRIKVILKKNFLVSLRINIFYEFDSRYIVSYKTLLKQIKKNAFDYVVCGSDQIWNPEFAGEPIYFADFAPKEKRIAYAASFGVENIEDNKREAYIKYLNEMHAISVREQAGADIVYELTGRDAKVAIDPTLMLEKEDWVKVSKKPKYDTPKRFILMYFIREIPEERRKYINQISEKYNLEIINLEELNPNDYWYQTGPSEFIWLIEHCSLMCTDSFHGSIFSVLMDVPFLVFERKDSQAVMSSRIDTLLSTLKLEDRRFNDQSGNDIFEKDYEHIPKILDEEREKAVNYLKNAAGLE